MVKVSIVVLMHNNELLNKCLNSIFSQTLKEIEVIGVNDNLSDERLKELKKYKNLTIIDKNLKSYNECLKMANGEYIIFVDSDDYLSDNMLEEFYGYASKYELDIVTGTYYKIKNNKEILIKSPKYKLGNVKTSPQILCLINYNLTNKLFKKQLLLNNKITFDEKKDYKGLTFLCKTLLKAKLIGKIDEPYYYSSYKKELGEVYKKEIFNTLKNILDYYKREYYLQTEINYVVIDKIIFFLLEQKYQKNKEIRKTIINDGYNFLNKNIKMWKKNKYYKKKSFFIKLLINHKKLLNLYIKVYAVFRKKKVVPKEPLLNNLEKDKNYSESRKTKKKS